MIYISRRQILSLDMTSVGLVQACPTLKIYLLVSISLSSTQLPPIKNYESRNVGIRDYGNK